MKYLKKKKQPTNKKLYPRNILIMKTKKNTEKLLIIKQIIEL